MKRIIWILVIVIFLLVFTLAISIFTKPIILFLVKERLGEVFIDSSVSIDDCSLKEMNLLILSGIEIEKESIYALKIKEIRISFSLLRRIIQRVCIKDVSITISISEENILEFTQYLNFAESQRREGNLVNTLELQNANISLDTKNIDLNADISLEYNLTKPSMDYLELKIHSLSNENLQLDAVSLTIPKDSPSGEFYIKEVSYNKVKIEGIESNVILKDKVLFFEDLSANFLDGRLKGNLFLGMGKDIEYVLNLKVSDLALGKVVEDFNLNNKVDMSGNLGGSVSLKGRNFKILSLNGDLSVFEPGGNLTIHDREFLENIADRTGQSLEILKEGFKDYHYDIGVLRLSLEKDDLIMDIALNGKKGKRNLNITVHDFLSFVLLNKI